MNANTHPAVIRSTVDTRTDIIRKAVEAGDFHKAESVARYLHADLAAALRQQQDAETSALVAEVIRKFFPASA